MASAFLQVHVLARPSRDHMKLVVTRSRRTAENKKEANSMRADRSKKTRDISIHDYVVTQMQTSYRVDAHQQEDDQHC